MLSAWLRRRPPGESPANITSNRAVQIFGDTPELSVLEKLDLTLVELERRTDFPGKESKFAYEFDYPLVYARHSQEALYYIKQLDSLGYVRCIAPGLWEFIIITAGGYKRLSEVRQASRQSASVFVAMWFDPSTSDIYDEAIQPAIREAGYKAVRIDREQHANRIDDEIIGRIKGSRFMVADFTGQRAGVYFEAGMMLGLGRTVIWMCKKEELGQVHFDTRQYNFIDYQEIVEAKKRLYDRIIAIEGEGPGFRSAT